MRATRIHVAGQKARELLCRRPFGRLARQDRPLAEAILRTLHDRHVGITPELCADLVRLARGARRGEPIDGLWAPLVAHLGQTYYHTSQEATANRAADPATARHSGGQLPGTGTFYFISRVVEPLVARACQDLGETYLFGADDSEPGVPKGFPGRYAGYAGRLRDRLQQLLDGSSVPELFWCDRALTLTAISQPRAERGEEVPDLPEVDVVGLAHLQRLRPTVPRRRLSRQPLRRPQVVVQNQHLPRSSNEGGIDGIFQTRRLADLQSMLFSELLNPRELLLDRLINSGYLALRRPPQQMKRRDVLIAGVLPCLSWLDSHRCSAMSVALVRAAWLDCVLRLSAWLQQVGLDRSELLWLESDRLGQVRSNRCLLHQLPVASLPVAGQPAPAFRNEVLIGRGWLPGYLDEHLPSRPLRQRSRRSARQGRGWDAPDATDGEPARPVRRMVRWSAAAWRGLRDHPVWQEESGEATGPVAGADGRLQWREYSTVLVMLFLPRVDPQQWRPELGTLQHTFGLSADGGCGLVVTGVPANACEPDEQLAWEIRARGKRRRISGNDVGRSTAQTADEPLESYLAAQLERTWIDLFFKEMLRE